MNKYIEIDKIDKEVRAVAREYLTVGFIGGFVSGLVCATLIFVGGIL
jgi:hypothetical protein